MSDKRIDVTLHQGSFLDKLNPDWIGNKLTEQVAERLFNKYDTLGEKHWQRGSGYSSGNWRVEWIEDAVELIALITEANNAKRKE